MSKPRSATYGSRSMASRQRGVAGTLGPGRRRVTVERGKNSYHAPNAATGPVDDDGVRPVALLVADPPVERGELALVQVGLQAGGQLAVDARLQRRGVVDPRLDLHLVAADRRRPRSRPRSAGPRPGASGG